MKSLKRIVALPLIAAFISTSVYVPGAQAQGMPMPWMPMPGVRVSLSPDFTPAVLKGMVIHPENPLRFDFLIYKGDSPIADPQAEKDEYSKLIKYFMASLTVPDTNQWVNLSPYEKNRIIQDNFGLTEMGRDLLAQDYLLKQITASLMYPEQNLGKKFWDTVFQRAHDELGTNQIPVNTFNKVWILPESASIYEKGNTVYLVNAHLKVMLEEDYLALQKHRGSEASSSFANSTPAGQDQAHALASKVVKEIIIPELEKEVNTGKNFATLRQAFSGMILAEWYKRSLKQSFLARIYMDKSKTKGVNQDDPKSNEVIFQRYLKAYKKGVFNYIKEDVDKYSQETIPRKYFSGGIVSGANMAMINVDAAQATPVLEEEAPKDVDVEADLSNMPKPQRLSLKVPVEVAKKILLPIASPASAISSIKTVSVPGSIDVSTLLNEQISELKKYIPKYVTIELATPTSLMVHNQTILSDENGNFRGYYNRNDLKSTWQTRFNTIMREIINNAVQGRNLNDGATKITINAQIDANDDLTIAINDNGLGMPNYDFNNIETTKMSSTDRGKGLGIIRRNVEDLGGEISIYNRPTEEAIHATDHGVTMTISIPAHTQEALASEAPANQAMTTAKEIAKDFADKKIITVPLIEKGHVENFYSDFQEWMKTQVPEGTNVKDVIDHLEIKHLSSGYADKANPDRTLNTYTVTYLKIADPAKFGFDGIRKPLAVANQPTTANAAMNVNILPLDAYISPVAGNIYQGKVLSSEQNALALIIAKDLLTNNNTLKAEELIAKVDADLRNISNTDIDEYIKAAAHLMIARAVRVTGLQTAAEIFSSITPAEVSEDDFPGYLHRKALISIPVNYLAATMGRESFTQVPAVTPAMLTNVQLEIIQNDILPRLTRQSNIDPLTNMGYPEIIWLIGYDTPSYYVISQDTREAAETLAEILKNNGIANQIRTNSKGWIGLSDFRDKKRAANEMIDLTNLLIPQATPASAISQAMLSIKEAAQDAIDSLDALYTKLKQGDENDKEIASQIAQQTRNITPETSARDLLNILIAVKNKIPANYSNPTYTSFRTALNYLNLRITNRKFTHYIAAIIASLTLAALFLIPTEAPAPNNTLEAIAKSGENTSASFHHQPEDVTVVFTHVNGGVRVVNFTKDHINPQVLNSLNTGYAAEIPHIFWEDKNPNAHKLYLEIIKLLKEKGYSSEEIANANRPIYSTNSNTGLDLNFSFNRQPDGVTLTIIDHTTTGSLILEKVSTSILHPIVHFEYTISDNGAIKDRAMSNSFLKNTVFPGLAGLLKVAAVLARGRQWEPSRTQNGLPKPTIISTPPSEKSDKAMNGGIDFNASGFDLRIKRDGNGVPLPLPMQDMKLLESIDGLVPIIIGIKPILSTNILSELRGSEAPSALASNA